jgi:hypothetical protein
MTTNTLVLSLPDVPTLHKMMLEDLGEVMF